MPPPAVALSIAGSDNSAGAGVQADLKTFSALGVYGLTAITCVVAEVPGRVSGLQPLEPKVVAEQIALCFEAFPVAAVKTGMLYAREIVETVCDALEWHKPMLVVDPVMVSTSGAALLRPRALDVYRQRLFKQATLVTPNLAEARVLLGRPVATLDEMRSAGRELAGIFGNAWLIKGGHLAGDMAIDLLFTGNEVTEFAAPFVRGVATHGTGCTLSAAITAGLARGLALREAVAEAKEFVTRAIAQHHRWNGTHALNHFPSSS